jgi:transposase-like protein
MGRMQKSIYQQRREAAEKKKAISLYKKGYSTRQTSDLLLSLYGIKRSRMWVCRVMKEAGISIYDLSS